MRNPLGCLAVVAGLFIAFLFVVVFGLFGLFAVGQRTAVPQPHDIHLSSPGSNGQMEMVEMQEDALSRGRSHVVVRSVLSSVLLLGGILLLPVLAIAVIVLIVRAASGPAPAPSGAPTVFELAWAIHQKLESFDARIERLESRLLERVDGPRTPGGPAAIRYEEGSQ